MKVPSDMTDRELDAAVAVEVMGYTEFPYLMGDHEFSIRRGNLELCYCAPGEQPHVSIIVEVPHYSTDIAAAWEVVEKMREGGWWFSASSDNEISEWSTRFLLPPTTDQDYRDSAKTLPRAICLAALAAVRGRR